MRRRPLEDDGRSLFDDITPLKLPKIPRADLSNPENFLQDSRETLGYIAKINKTLVEKIAQGEQPNYPLLKALTELTRATVQSITSYDGIIKIDTRDTNNPPSEVNITIATKELPQ